MLPVHDLSSIAFSFARPTMFRFLLITYLLLCNVCNAQQPPYFNIGSTEFGNTDIYSLYFDDASSLLYAGTANGMYVYHGDQFRSVKAHPEQKGASLFDLQKGIGKIFCKNLSGQIFTLNNQELELVFELPTEQLGLSFWYFFHEDRFWLVTNRSISSYQIDKEVIQFQTEKRYLVDFFDKGGVIDNVSIMSFGARLATRSSNGYVDVINGQVRFTEYDSDFVGRHYFEIENAQYATDLAGNVMQLSNNEIIAQFEYNESFMNLTNDLVIGKCQTKGMHLLSEDNLLTPQLIYEDKFISAFAKAKNGTVFLGTFKNGVMVLPNLNSNEVQLKDELLTSVVATKNSTLVSTRSGKIIEINDEASSLLYQNRENYDRVCLTPLMNGEIPGKPEILHIPSKNIVNPKDTWIINEKAILVAQFDRITLMHDANYKRFPEYHSGGETFKVIAQGARFNSVAYSLKEEAIYYASNKGLFKQEYSTGAKTEVIYQGRSLLVNDIYCKNEQVWLATQESGLILFENGKPIKSWNENSSLSTKHVLKLRFHNSKLYALTTKGLARLTQHGFEYLGIEEGIIRPAIIDFDISQNVLTVLYKSSVHQIPLGLESVKKEYPVGKIYFDSITVNGQKPDVRFPSKFDHDRNTFSFFYEFRAIESRAESKLYYRLLPLDKDWVLLPDSDLGEVTFKALSDGSYSFQMKAVYDNREQYSEIINFTIDKPFWRKWWFVGGCIFIVLLFIIFYFRWRLRNQRRRLEAINQVNTSKITAIQSQMNPHFIFNALNSIQALVLKGDTDNTYGFINKFSHLMRRTLTNSDKTSISLDEEMELLQSYLELEKLRFRENFNYAIECAVDEEIFIPPMLIQPFVENAIIHGLLHKDGRKDLSIQFEIEEKSLVCTIIDNGVGRERAKEISRKRHRDHDSFATRSIENRLNLLKEKHGTNLGYVFEDCLDESAQVIGTKLRVIIPIINAADK